MKSAHLPVIFFVIAAGACGPGETSPPPDAGTPTNDAGSGCDGVCLPGFPSNWYPPQLVWMGDEAAAPLCPAISPVEGFSGHGYVEGPLHCNACTCGPTSGSCEPPATVTAASTSCPGAGSGVAHTSSDPPAGWVGMCNGENPIPAGKLCDGVPCVKSITIAPTRPKEIGCLPTANSDASPPPPPWNRFVRACHDTPSPPGCSAPGEVCLPAAPSPEFKQCIAQWGPLSVLDCPASYPDQNIFYSDGFPGCAPCACEAPTKGNCTGSIDLFQDGSCSTPLGSSIDIDATGPVCVDVPPGSALGSKSAVKAFYNPGSCKPVGGAPQALVVCCRP